MPIPVSDTIKNSSILSFICAVLITSMHIFPVAVNFNALDNRLFNICPIRSSSAITYSGILPDSETTKSSPFSVIFLSWLSFMKSIILLKRNLCGSRVNLPASSLEKSKILLISMPIFSQHRSIRRSFLRLPSSMLI